MKTTYIVYETDTMRPAREYTYEKAAINFLAKCGAGFSVTDKATFLSLPMPTKTVRSLMTGAEVEIPVDTPRCCDPSSELYWSM